MKVGMRQPYHGRATTHRYPVIVTAVFVAYTRKFKSYEKRGKLEEYDTIIREQLDEGIVE
jgi:hypothetical protein